MSDFKVMLAHNYSPARIKKWGTIYVEPKLDGVRVIVTVDGATHDPTYYSRNGRELKMLGHLDNEVIMLAARLTKLNKNGYASGVMFDCELISSTGNFEDISGVIHRKDVTEECKEARLHLFHAMPLRSFLIDCEDTQPQDYRGQALAEAFEWLVTQKGTGLLTLSDPIKVDNEKQIERIYKKHRKANYEGTMVKDLGQPWIGKRTHAWMKMKAVETVDVKIVDFKKGKGKYEGTLGSLICKHKGARVQVAGMDDDMRDELFKNFKKYKGRYVEVEYQPSGSGKKETVHGALRHPRFIRLRPDKDKP